MMKTGLKAELNKVNICLNFTDDSILKVSKAGTYLRIKGDNSNLMKFETHKALDFLHDIQESMEFQFYPFHL